MLTITALVVLTNETGSYWSIQRFRPGPRIYEDNLRRHQPRRNVIYSLFTALNTVRTECSLSIYITVLSIAEDNFRSRLIGLSVTRDRVRRPYHLAALVIASRISTFVANYKSYIKQRRSLALLANCRFFNNIHSLLACQAARSSTGL